MAAYARARRQANPEKHRRAEAEWRAKNKDKAAAYNRRFYAKNRDRERARAQAWRDANPDRVKAAAKVWCEVNKQHRSEVHRAWRQSDPEATKARRKRNYEIRRDQELAKAREYKAANKERLLAASAQYWRDHPELNRHRASLRRAAEKRATPSWADKDKMLAVYAEAVRLSRETGIRHDVDHIVPLQSKIICGLHWEGNMQILTAEANRRKKNRFSPDIVMSGV